MIPHPNSPVVTNCAGERARINLQMFNRRSHTNLICDNEQLVANEAGSHTGWLTPRSLLRTSDRDSGLQDHADGGRTRNYLGFASGHLLVMYALGLAATPAFSTNKIIELGVRQLSKFRQFPVRDIRIERGITHISKIGLNLFGML